MIGVYVTVPVTCFRMGHAREYWETHPLPPPSTCYGFLLSLVGEQQRERHVGCRVTAALLGSADLSVVLRTFWRIKNKKNPPGVGNNKTPGHQQLLTNVELIIWLDSTDEVNADPKLESRVNDALDPTRRGALSRFGGLSFGESTHLVNTVSLVTNLRPGQLTHEAGLVFLQDCADSVEGRRITLPVWVDHVGSKHTNYASGVLKQTTAVAPHSNEIPRIAPKS